jgi:hypothetical protein
MGTDCMIGLFVFTFAQSGDSWLDFCSFDIIRDMYCYFLAFWLQNPLSCLPLDCLADFSCCFRSTVGSGHDLRKGKGVSPSCAFRKAALLALRLWKGSSMVSAYLSVIGFLRRRTPGFPLIPGLNL